MTEEEEDELVRRIARTWGTISDLDDYEVLKPMPPTRWKRHVGTPRQHGSTKGRRHPNRNRPTRVDWRRAEVAAHSLGPRATPDQINLARCFLLQAAIIKDLQARCVAYQRLIHRLRAELDLADERALLAIASPAGMAQEIKRLQSVVAGLRQSLIDQDDAWRRRLPEMVRRLGVAGRGN